MCIGTRLGNAAANGNVLRGLKIGRDPDDFGKLRTQAVDDLGRVDIALLARRVTFKRSMFPVFPKLGPKLVTTLSTAGSLRIVRSTSVSRLIIFWGETSCEASAMPVIRSMSWIGKKPLGV